jgi:hypothetical protein
MRRALLFVLILVLTLGPAEARHHGHRHWGLWGFFSTPYAHRHGQRKNAMTHEEDQMCDYCHDKAADLLSMLPPGK